MGKTWPDGTKFHDVPAEPRKVPIEAMRYSDQQRERAKTDPVLAARLIREEEKWEGFW